MSEDMVFYTIIMVTHCRWFQITKLGQIYFVFSGQMTGSASCCSNTCFILFGSQAVSLGCLACDWRLPPCTKPGWQPPVGGQIKVFLALCLQRKRPTWPSAYLNVNNKLYLWLAGVLMLMSQLTHVEREQISGLLMWLVVHKLPVKFLALESFML